MDKKEWVKIEGIIDQVLDAPLAERKELLNGLCENNQDLKEQVFRMLDSMDNSDPFFDKIAESKDHLFANVEHEIARETDENFIGKTIDNYKIQKKIGTGGMGTVFLASRCDGVFDKKAAIKILRREYAVPAVKLQFKLERQILANLKHPGIARLYDGGIYKGLPYLVMEYVAGMPIDKYCNEKRLTVDQRISLFKSVLEIVRYAHNNLVIHRDLKPENILITEKGEVKILDFGISQLEKETPDSGDQNPQKHFLTPVYASPEQINGEKIVTSSDIYSLGFLLQKILTDQLPFDIKNKDINEIRDIKLSERPVSASITFESLPEETQKCIAYNRNTKPKYLKKKLSNDLDKIILKTLESDRNKRYSTIGQVIDDIQFYEKQLPVSACSNTFFYRTSKYLTRNSYPLTLSASLLVVILLTSIITINRVNAEHQLALSEAHKAEEMTGFLIELFEAADPTNTQHNDINVRDLLYHGLDRTENISDPEIRASMLTVMGDALTKISDFETADIVLNKAVEENINAYGDNSVSTADALFAFGLKHSKNSMWHLALPYFQKSYEIYSIRLDQNNHKVLSSLSKLGLAMLNEGNVDSAEVYMETAYNRMQNTRDVNSPELLNTMVDYAYYLGSTNSHEESIEMLNSVLESYLEIGLENDFRLIKPYHYTAINYRHLGQYEKAVDYYKKALTISKNTIGEDHLTTRRIRSNLINPLSRLGEHDRVVYHYKRNIELMENRFSYNHWRTGQAIGAYGGYQKNLGNYQEAITLYEKNLEIYQESIGPDHIWTAYVEGALAAVNRFLNNHSEADRLFERHIEIYRERYPDYNNDHIGQIRRLIKMYENAEGDYDDIIEIYGKLLN